MARARHEPIGREIEVSKVHDTRVSFEKKIALKSKKAQFGEVTNVCFSKAKIEGF